MDASKFFSLLTATVLLAVVPSSAWAETERVPTLTDEEVVLLAERALLSNLGPPAPMVPITGDEGVDSEIRAMAEARGYRRRPGPPGGLVEVDGHLLQPAAAVGWQALRKAAAAAGFSIRLVSGYRSETTQVNTFLSGVDGSTLADFDDRLAWSAPPGYSKHHTGYVIDLALPSQSHNDFGSSPAFQWLVADNYRVLKSFGFLPSYPPAGPPQGPNPEAWEYTFIGGWTFRCWETLLFGDVPRVMGGPPACPS